MTKLNTFFKHISKRLRALPADEKERIVKTYFDTYVLEQPNVLKCIASNMADPSALFCTSKSISNAGKEIIRTFNWIDVLRQRLCNEDDMISARFISYISRLPGNDVEHSIDLNLPFGQFLHENDILSFPTITISGENGFNERDLVRHDGTESVLEATYNGIRQRETLLKLSAVLSLMKVQHMPRPKALFVTLRYSTNESHFAHETVRSQIPPTEKQHRFLGVAKLCCEHMEQYEYVACVIHLTMYDASEYGVFEFTPLQETILRFLQRTKPQHSIIRCVIHISKPLPRDFDPNVNMLKYVTYTTSSYGDEISQHTFTGGGVPQTTFEKKIGIYSFTDNIIMSIENAVLPYMETLEATINDMLSTLYDISAFILAAP